MGGGRGDEVDRDCERKSNQAQGQRKIELGHRRILGVCCLVLSHMAGGEQGNRLSVRDPIS